MLAALTYTLVIGGGMLFYRLFIVYPELERITLDSHKDDFKIIKYIYQNQLSAMNYMNLDWAKWDDTLRYSKQQNNNFIVDNILSDSFEKSMVDIVAIYNENQEHLYTAKKINGQFVEQENLLELTSDIDINTIFKEKEASGIIRLNDRLAFFTTQSIQDSHETKPSSGQLIFISTFKEDFRNQIKILTNSQIQSNIVQGDDLSNIETYNPDDISKLKQHYTFSLKNHKDKVIAILTIGYSNNPIPARLDKTTLFSIAILLLLPIIITMIVYVLFLRPMTFIFNKIGSMRETGHLIDIKIQTHIFEIDEFIKSFNAFINQMKLYQLKLKAESTTDGLTGLHNRRYFDSKYDELWRTCIRNNTSIAIIIMDIDFFKKYNDYYGHQKGDDALRLVSKQLKKQTRRANEFLARYGGEEFVIIIENIDQNSLEVYLESLLSHITMLEIEHIPSTVSDYLSMSCGACIIEKTGPWLKDKKDEALRLADKNLYQAKQSGRNRFHISSLSQD